MDGILPGMSNHSNATTKPGSAQQHTDSFPSIAAEMLALGGGSGGSGSGGGVGLTMTSASWMQVAARATQLAAQLREMENLGLAGACVSPHSSLPPPSTAMAGGMGRSFAPQQACSGNGGSSAMWGAAQASAMGPFSHPAMHLMHGGAANPSAWPGGGTWPGGGGGTPWDMRRPQVRWRAGEGGLLDLIRKAPSRNSVH